MIKFETLKSLAPQIDKVVWAQLVLVLEWFGVNNPSPVLPERNYFKWLICVPTLHSSHPQAYIEVENGQVKRFFWTRPQAKHYRYTYWEDWVEKAQQTSQAWEGKKGAEAASRREAERLARDLAAKEMEQGWGYDVAVTVTVNVTRLPRKNVALPKGPRWNWTAVQVRFQNQPKAHRVEQLLADQLQHFQLEVEDTRTYNNLLHDFQGWIVKQVQANRLVFNIHDEQAVELVKTGGHHG